MKVLDLGLQEYNKAWLIQKELLEKRVSEEVEDTLILVEHHPVYTVGRAGNTFKPVGEYAPKVPVIDVERGGKITFHGPGQIVGYPIFLLHHHDIRLYLSHLEKILVSVLLQVAKLNCKPYPANLLLEPGQLQTGVWIGDRKLASIGIAVKHWVSYHGFALNVSTDLKYFQAISPCGFHGEIMTTVERELTAQRSLPKQSFLYDKLKAAFIEEFSELSKKYSRPQRQPQWKSREHFVT